MTDEHLAEIRARWWPRTQFNGDVHELLDEVQALRTQLNTERAIVQGVTAPPAFPKQPVRGWMPREVVEVNFTPAADAASDPVNHPAHYTGGPIECIEAIESIGDGLAFCRGNAIKYLWRLQAKGKPLEDARKARWYLDRLIRQLEATPQPA